MNITSVPVTQTTLSHDFISIGIDHWYELVIRFNWIAVILGIVIVYVLSFLLKKGLKNLLVKLLELMDCLSGSLILNSN